MFRPGRSSRRIRGRHLQGDAARASQPGPRARCAGTIPARMGRVHPLVVAAAVGLLAAAVPRAAPAQITFKAAASAGTGSSGVPSLALSKPSGVSAGDFLLAQLTVEGGSKVGAITSPGWILVDRTNVGSDVAQAILWRFAETGDASSYTFSWGSNRRSTGGILAYTGVDAAPINAVQSSTGDSGTPAAPSVTTTVPNARLVQFWGIKKSASFSGYDPSAGISERYDQANGGAVPSSAAVDEPLAATGSTSQRTAVSSAGHGKFVAHSVAVAPSVPTPTPTPTATPTPTPTPTATPTPTPTATSTPTPTPTPQVGPGTTGLTIRAEGTQDESPPDPARLIRVELFLDDVVAITGMSLRLHFDSTHLTFETVENVFATGYLGHDVRPDTNDHDNDPATDSFVLLGWNDLTTNWPGNTTAQFLARVRFLQPTATQTVVRFSAPSLPPGYALAAPPFVVPDDLN